MGDKFELRRHGQALVYFSSGEEGTSASHHAGAGACCLSSFSMAFSVFLSLFFLSISLNLSPISLSLSYFSTCMFQSLSTAFCIHLYSYVLSLFYCSILTYLSRIKIYLVIEYELVDDLITGEWTLCYLIFLYTPTYYALLHSSLSLYHSCSLFFFSHPYGTVVVPRERK